MRSERMIAWLLKESEERKERRRQPVGVKSII